jgi:hypothetical protein
MTEKRWSSVRHVPPPGVATRLDPELREAVHRGGPLRGDTSPGKRGVIIVAVWDAERREMTYAAFDAIPELHPRVQQGYRGRYEYRDDRRAPWWEWIDGQAS